MMPLTRPLERKREQENPQDQTLIRVNLKDRRPDPTRPPKLPCSKRLRAGFLFSNQFFPSQQNVVQHSNGDLQSHGRFIDADLIFTRRVCANGPRDVENYLVFKNNFEDRTLAIFEVILEDKVIFDVARSVGTDPSSEFEIEN